MSRKLFFGLWRRWRRRETKKFVYVSKAAHQCNVRRGYGMWNFRGWTYWFIGSDLWANQMNIQHDRRYRHRKMRLAARPIMRWMYGMAVFTVAATAAFIAWGVFDPRVDPQWFLPVFGGILFCTMWKMFRLFADES